MAASTHAQSADLTAGLVSCWNFEEASGSRLDSWGTFTLADNNTVTRATGKHGYAASFLAANSEYLSLLSNSYLTGDFTIVMWQKATAFTSYGALWYYGTVFITPINSTDRLFVGRTTNTSIPIVANQWNMVVASFGGGALSISANAGTPSTVVSGAVVYAAPTYIGRFGSSQAYYSGLIDTTAVWNRPLSTAEITALYNGGAGLNCAGIVNTAVPDPTPTPAPIPVAPPEGATVYLVDLPSGSSGSVVMTATAGELLGVTAVAALITINLFIILRDMVMTIGIKRDDT